MARYIEMFLTTFPSGEGSNLAGVMIVIEPSVTEFSVSKEIPEAFIFRRSSRAIQAAVPVRLLILKPP